MLAGAGTLLFIAMIAGFGWFFTNSYKLFAPALEQSNPDFELLKYHPQTAQIDVRHKPSGKIFRKLQMPPGFGRIRKVDLAIKPQPVPDWARYPKAASQDGHWVAAAKSSEVMAFYSDQLFEHLYIVEQQTDGLIEACNAKTFECAVVVLVGEASSSRPSASFQVSFRSAP